MNTTIPAVTKNLLIINGLFFLATLVFEARGIDLVGYLGAFYPESVNFKIWQVISHMFMHGGFAHIFFNMFALWMFGSTVEMTLGAKRFLILYFVAGLGGFILFNLANYFQVEQLKPIVESQGYNIADFKNALYGKDFSRGLTQEALDLLRFYVVPMVGASGAIYGVLVAFGVLFPDAKLMLIFFPVPVKAKYFIPGMIILELVMDLSNTPGDNIAHFAHLGGALFGFLMVRHWKKNRFRYN